MVCTLHVLQGGCLVVLQGLAGLRVERLWGYEPYGPSCSTGTARLRNPESVQALSKMPEG
jgi:hypothetical protein